MTADRALLRASLRKRRTSLAKSTLLASSSSRRGAFSAAMQQFEELMNASASVGPSARPITLYYAVVQAGLAIAAARKANPWSFSRHGLKADVGGPTFADFRVSPEGQGAFQIVGEATGSPLLHESVALHALWSSIPDFEGMYISASSTPHSLPIYEDDQLDNQSAPFSVHIVNGQVVGQQAPEPDESFVATVIVPSDNPGPGAFKQRLTDLLAICPALTGFEVVDGSYEEVRDGRWTGQARWARKIDLSDVAPEYRRIGSHYLRIPLDQHGNPPPSPFMTWWAVLYAFSMLARYFPLEWAAALDIDKSSIAHILEYGLDLALDVIPHLVMEALDGGLILFPTPLEV